MRKLLIPILFLVFIFPLTTLHANQCHSVFASNKFSTHSAELLRNVITHLTGTPDSVLHSQNVFINRLSFAQYQKKLDELKNSHVTTESINEFDRLTMSLIEKNATLVDLISSELNYIDLEFKFYLKPKNQPSDKNHLIAGTMATVLFLGEKFSSKVINYYAHRFNFMGHHSPVEEFLKSPLSKAKVERHWRRLYQTVIDLTYTDSLRQMLTKNPVYTVSFLEALDTIIPYLLGIKIDPFDFDPYEDIVHTIDRRLNDPQTGAKNDLKNLRYLYIESDRILDETILSSESNVF